MSTFLEIVSRDFAQTFIIDSTHRQGAYTKISHVENSCNPKKGKKSILFQFSLKLCGILALCLRRFTNVGGGSAEWLKKIRDFLETFLPERANVLIGSQGSLTFYY